jgi:sulfur carrier protein
MLYTWWVTFELNGETQKASGPLSVRALLERCELADRRVAVAINARVVPRSHFEQVEVRDGDRVEVIHAVGGG